MKSLKFSCPDDLRALLKKQAARESRGTDLRVSESQIVRRALREHFDRLAQVEPQSLKAGAK